MQAPRTSESHPLQIATIEIAGGRVGLSLCPGKHQAAPLSGAPWARDLRSDLEEIQRQGFGTVLTLIEDGRFARDEFSELQVAALRTLPDEIGLQWIHLPIQDVSPPPDEWETAWARHEPAVLEQIRGGGGLFVHCKGGLGRAGTISAFVLIRLGLSPEEAIERVREARPGAIETAEQEQWVLSR